MLINNPDALKEWLISILDPLCDADPICLARYVLALLKKDKSIADLKQLMNDQLNVFLAGQTETFLQRLFEVIASEEYLNAVPSIVNNGNASAIPAGNLEIQSSQDTLLTSGGQDVNVLSKTTNDSTTELDTDPVNSSPLGASITKLREVSPISPVKPGNENEHHRRDARRRDRSRSRSRSRPRRDKYGSGRHSNYRNKSPGTEQDRRKSNPFRRNSGHEPKSPKFYKRSDSPSNVEGSEERKGTRSLSPGQKNDRCRDFDEKGYCMRGETCPWDHGVNPVVLEDINNSALMAIQTPHIRNTEYNPDVPEIWPQGSGFINGPNRGAIPNPPFPLPLGATGPTYRVPPFSGPLGPGATTPLQRELISVPVVEANSGGDISASQKRRYEPEDTVAVAEGPTKRKLPINSRLGPPNRVGVQNNCSLELRKVPRGLNSIAHLNNHFCKFGKIVNIQISYEGDPEAAIVTFSTHAEANVAYRSTEAVLNNRFIKVFWHTPGPNANTDGNQSTPNSNTNATPTTASNASKDENTTNNNYTRKNNQYSLNNTVPANPIPASTEFAKSASNAVASSSAPNSNTSNSPSVYTKTATTPTVIPPASAMTTNRVRGNRISRAAPEAIRKKKEEQVKAAVQLAHGLHKRKHELLQGYLKQMRSCVELVEKLESSDPQRTGLLGTIKNLQINIDKLNKEIASDQAQITAQMTPVQMNNAHPFRKSKELQKKELLDIELELIAAQQDGNDTTDIQRRLEELQKSLGTVTKPSFPATRNSPRVRPAPPGSTSFDRRPTTILVAGFDSNDCDAVLGHFKHYGEITKNDIDKVTPTLKISYATRLNAEQAMLRGRRFKDKQLQISWFVPNAEPPKILSDDDLLDETIADDALPLEDEEDDEETEDRSWRR